MRCSCALCDTWMVHSESMKLGCVCPQCGHRCNACLGTDTVLTPADLHTLPRDPLFLNRLREDFADPIPEDDALPPPDGSDWID